MIELLRGACDPRPVCAARRALLLLYVVAASAPVTAVAQAGAGDSIEVVELAPMAAGESCPEPSALRTRIAALRADAKQPRPLRIELAGAPGARNARLQLLDTAGVRTLELADRSCDEALEAIAVAAVMLIEDAARAQPDSTEAADSATPVAPEPSREPAPHSAPATPPEPDRTQPNAEAQPPGVFILLAGAPTFGLLRGVGASGLFGAELAWNGFSLGVEAFNSTTATQSLGAPVRVHMQLFAGQLSGCARMLRLSRATRLRLCALAGLGRVQADADGVLEGNSSAALLWLALGGGVGLEAPSPWKPLAFQLGLEALVPLRRDAFVVEPQPALGGTAARAEVAPVGLRLRLGLRLSL